MKHWHLASMNDGLFIIDTPPRPSNDNIWHERLNGPSVVLNVTELSLKKALVVVEAHNSRVEELERQLADMEEVLDEARWDRGIANMRDLGPW